MTSALTATLLSRYMLGGDFASLTALAQTEILAAINAALSSLYDALSPNHSSTTLSAPLAAPLTLTISLATGANTFTGDTAPDDYRGCTLTVPGSFLSEVTSPNSILDTYQGATLASASATLYADAIPIPHTVRIISDTIFHLYLSETSQPLRLTPYPDSLSGGLTPPPFAAGLPRHYIIQPCGPGATHAALLRLYPAPASACTVRFNATVSPNFLSLADLFTDAPLPCSEEAATSYLLPAAIARLTSSPDFARPDLTPAILRNLDVATAWLAMRPRHHAPPHSRIGTPH